MLCDGLARRHDCDGAALMIKDLEASMDTEASVSNDALAHERAGAVDCLSFCGDDGGDT